VNRKGAEIERQIRSLLRTLSDLSGLSGYFLRRKTDITAEAAEGAEIERQIRSLLRTLSDLSGLSGYSSAEIEPRSVEKELRQNGSGNTFLYQKSYVRTSRARNPDNEINL
jgi:hypothetical protein